MEEPFISLDYQRNRRQQNRKRDNIKQKIERSVQKSIDLLKTQKIVHKIAVHKCVVFQVEANELRNVHL